MTFEDLRVFIAVCEAGSLSGAARDLQCSQPAVSHHVRRLEREYGTQLLVRTRTGVLTTDAGDTVLAAARRVTRALDESQVQVQEMVGKEALRVRIGGVAGGMCPFLIDAVATLAADHPDINVELVMRSRTREALDDVRSGHVDLIYTGFGPPLEGLAQWEVARSSWVVVVTGDDPFAELDAVGRETFCSRGPAAYVTPGPTIGILRHELASDAFDPGAMALVDDKDNAVRMVRLGIAAAVLPSVWLPTTPPGLVKVPLPFVPPLTTGWIGRQGSPLATPVRQVAAHHRRVLVDLFAVEHAALIDAPVPS